MRLTIQYKLFLAMLSAIIAVVFYMGGVIQWSFDKGFLEYIDTTEKEELQLLAEELEAHYAQFKSWEELQNNPLFVARFYVQTLPEGKKKEFILKKIDEKQLPPWLMEKERSKQTATHPRHPMERTVIVDIEGNTIFGWKQEDVLPDLLPIMYQNQRVGGIGIYPSKKLSETHQLLFVKKQRYVIFFVGIAAVLITIGLSLPLAYHLTKPVRRLSRAARKLISGDYTTRVPVSVKDEIGQLSHDFNTLAENLHNNETLRKLWVSDIAHELRTPLHSLRGEIEAVQDGIRQPDTRTFNNLHQSVMRLSRLVDDLYDLSRSDLGVLSYIHKSVNLKQLIDDEASAKLIDIENAGLTLKLNTGEKPVIVNGDKQRLQQLVGNLLGNSITYTEKGGSIGISIHDHTSQVLIDISDSEPGVPDESIPHLFERLYRVDQSRNRTLGGAGLGLAICREIVTAHNGKIWAQDSPDGGLSIQIALPVTGNENG